MPLRPIRGAASDSALILPRCTRMSAYNKVVWSEGLFLQPQHFQQQDRYFERYVETRCQALIAAQLGLHRDRDRTRFSEHRQVRAAAARRRVSRRHAVPDAGRRPAAGADRRRRERARSDAVSGRAAAPIRRARRRSRGRRPTDWCGTTSASCRRAMPPSSGGDTALARSRGAADAAPARERRDAGVCLRAAGAPRRVPRRQAGRARRQFHPDRAARAAAAPARHVHDRAARAAASARRSARRAGDRRPAAAPRRSSPTS